MPLTGAPSADGDRTGTTTESARVSRLTGVEATRARPGFDCTSWTDMQLVSADREARDEAFAELFRRHSASVTAVAKMVLGNTDAGCDDVVAEVFAALWCAPEKFDPDRGSLLGLLRLRARGRSIDLLRSESCRHRYEGNQQNAGTDHGAIDVQLIAAEASADVHHALSRLPECERTPIEFAFFAGMSYRAVASLLDIPEGTVKSRIRSGLRRLRWRVDGEDKPTPSASAAPTTNQACSGAATGVLE